MHTICLYTVTGQDEEYTFAGMIWQNILSAPMPAAVLLLQTC